MFKDQLLQISRFQHERELVEAANLARQFDPAHQVDRHVDAIFAKVIQERVLNILLSSIVHFQNRLSLF